MAANVGIQFDALAFTQSGTSRSLWAIGHRTDQGEPPSSSPKDPNWPYAGTQHNLLYQLDPNTGAVLTAKTTTGQDPIYSNPINLGTVSNSAGTDPYGGGADRRL